MSAPSQPSVSAAGRSQALKAAHDCPYMGVRSCCSTDFCEPCVCYDPAEGLPTDDARSRS